ncbi:MAG: patatin-like phospholipase family protein [Chloroflexi bacterium]|nr:patatin-like phospholipase family protein [Chloroflexota bacterium]
MQHYDALRHYPIVKKQNPNTLQLQGCSRALSRFTKEGVPVMVSAKHSRRSKTALVLAGGGLTGAVYEIGALRAIDDLLVDRTVNDFDIYVGTSAGALVSSFLAHGFSPHEILDGLAGERPGAPPLQPRDVFSLSRQDLLRWGIKIPRTIVGAWSHYLRHRGDMTLFDVVWLFLEALPAGFYDNKALENYLERVLDSQGKSNHFQDLDRELYIIATDLDNGQRAVFSKEHQAHAPISRAVAASSAVPVLYKPVRIDGHDYVDGAARANASLDIAIEHGAKLVVCINPMVPLDNSEHKNIPLLGPDSDYLSDKGLSAIAQQITRISAHSALHYHIKQLRKAHPDVDIILIEPSRHDYKMFFYNAMRYSARLILAQHGFESVTLRIAEDYAHYKTLLGRHDIAITRRVLLQELRALQQDSLSTRTLRRILENPPEQPRLKRRRAATRPLRRALTELNATLEKLETLRA